MCIVFGLVIFIINLINLTPIDVNAIIISYDNKLNDFNMFQCILKNPRTSFESCIGHTGRVRIVLSLF